MNALHPLGQLIQSVEDSKGWTLREIARRIERAGESISHAYIGRLKKQPLRSISYETIQLLALGLGVPERVVATAALETMGVHDIGAEESGAAVAIARDPDLSERDRRILLAVVREMQSEQADQQQAGGRDEPRSTVEDHAQPDGVTATVDDEHPWEQDGYDLAAKKGRNRGREVRQRQDSDGEDGGV